MNTENYYNSLTREIRHLLPPEIRRSSSATNRPLPSNRLWVTRPQAAIRFSVPTGEGRALVTPPPIPRENPTSAENTEHPDTKECLRN